MSDLEKIDDLKIYDMEKIDQDLYNRQIYVIGNQGMLKLSKAHVFMLNIGGLGVEIAKNIVLAGVQSFTFIDTKCCELNDLGCQFYITDNDVKNKITRANASIEQLRKLNPYVNIDLINKNLEELSDPELENFLTTFDTVILTEIENLDLAKKINTLCRSLNIKFLMADVYGLFSWSFSDFGENFNVTDPDGEEYPEGYISNIKPNGEHSIVEILDKKLHDLEDDDCVQFYEVKGMDTLNGQVAKVKTINPYSFSIDLDLNECPPFVSGLYKKIKIVKRMNFQPLEDQLSKPDLTISDLSESKFQQPYLIHVALHSLHLYYKTELRSLDDYLKVSRDVAEKFESKNSMSLDRNALKRVCSILYASRNSRFPSLCAFLGGVIAQEALKSITNKFTPIKQWFHLDCIEVYEASENAQLENRLVKNDRFDNLRLCFGGEETVEKLKQLRLFMVGCGAIGCEMMKNYALLGISCDANKGLISITDNDLIEKSNLNRQFLFRQEDIQKSKSLSAHGAVLKMNPKMNVKAYEKKVCPQTEAELFTDDFFKFHDLFVNALDNVEARRYMDNRCVSNQKPLLESGTLGPKGHVQVILPHLTESYNSQRDPGEAGIPYCTLKSFPSNIDHCIQWSRDKFESNFSLKPALVGKFLIDNQKSLQGNLETMKTNENAVFQGYVQFVKVIRSYCLTWNECLMLARIKFEKYFANKAKSLLYHYPLDHLMNDGTPFWKLPRRKPEPLKFDLKNRMHIDFVRSYARLYADTFNIHIEPKSDVELETFLRDNEKNVPIWKPKNKHIETDESKKKEDITTSNNDLTNLECAQIIEAFIQKIGNDFGSVKVNPLSFEKDLDSNGHIDFIHAASNLRAAMYSIDEADRLQVKKISGKIIPAIATTTSCVAGLVSIELVKIVQGNWKLDNFRNLFLNLGLSLFLLSEPGPCVKSKIAENCYVSLWDKWTVQGTEKFLLKDFICTVKSTFNLTVSGVIMGTKSIYMPVMPTHAKRLNKTMIELLKGMNHKVVKGDYVDLFLTYEECDQNENRDQNNLCPPIRYFFV